MLYGSLEIRWQSPIKSILPGLVEIVSILLLSQNGDAIMIQTQPTQPMKHMPYTNELLHPHYVFIEEISCEHSVQSTA